MELQLAGRTAFISGSTQGIGLAIATQLAEEGARVIVNGRSQEAVDRAVAELRRAHPGARHEGVPADFADDEAVARLVGELGEVDILVNNVGVFGLADFATTGDEDWERYWQVNLLSAVRLSRAVLPRMLERGTGRVLLISSESGVNVPADMVPYGVTKAALIALGNGLAKLTRGTAVTVNTILGGPTYSHGVASVVERIAAESAAPVDAIKAHVIGGNRTTLLERFIEPREIAALAAYLSSPLASATNGAALRADGGVLTGML
ncbi:SDR family NAD(P)-dependent oxidoreductase [Arenivirga flava]|uniref:Oxidoreductase n=1 Tax=Arenivirga flava TaxID=1930060 RepID=A0AA37UER6_9MICO|nr:SDR family NAD(P)-dependent oxidoreductase [Arenivirga flava]GMA28869.1 oxidoreductase [Arenivirga flava]